MATQVSSIRKEQEAAAIPVQMTNLVPVRVVSVHGDFFDTEIHQDAPLRILQSAVEDCFKVRPELQLLTHNRQQINTNISLKRNGCLLLKGDPYVKIVLDIKKGTKLNLVCQMSHHEPIPLACEGTDTVWEVKKKFCAAINKPELTPQRIRLLWRYWELNDKATLDYYHLHTNAKLSVMKKRGFSAKQSQLQQQQQQQQQQEKKTQEEEQKQQYILNSSRKMIGKSFKKENQEQKKKEVTPIEAQNRYPFAAVPTRTIPYNNNNNNNNNNEITNPGVGPSTSVGPFPSNPIGHAVIPLNPTIEYSVRDPFTKFQVQTQNFPSQDIELAKASQTASMMELNQLRQVVASLEHRIESCGVDRAGYEILEESYRATLARVSELEETLGRFQGLLKRALMLM